MKHEEIERVEVYYEWIKGGSWFISTNHRHFFTIVFRAGLQSYLRIVTIRMKRSTL